MIIMTHAGQAHADDLMAVALILIKTKLSPKQATILRVGDCDPERHPEADFVVDVGRRLEPSRGWFDHHQFPKDAPPNCAFTLVADHYGIDRNALDWMERLAVLDSKGPFTWYENNFGRPAKNLAEINKALGPDVFSWFVHKANAGYKNPDAFHEALDMSIDWLGAELEYLGNRDRNIEYAKGNMKVMELGDFKMLYFNQTEMRGIADVTEVMAAADPKIMVSAKPDDRGNGYSATRLNNNLQVDFLPRKSEAGCVFAHENGFCLKWRNDWPSFLDAVRRSVLK